jgi:mannose-6-phosphate isomerase-like protein (cupin superfamily)
VTQRISAAARAAGRRYVLGRELTATVWTTGAETDGRHDLSECRQPPDSQTPLHLHTRYEERLWVLSGSLTVWAGPDTVSLGPGDFYVIPTNLPHAVRSGPDGSHALQISSPAGFAELVARTGTPAHLAAPDTELDAELFLAVTTELGDVVLGPPGTLPAGR